MKAWTSVFVLLALTGCVNFSVHTGSKSSKDSTGAAAREAGVPDTSLARSINAFAIDLYRKLASEPGNLICSPYSISTVLTSLVPGAAGRTQAEMLRVLHLGAPITSNRMFVSGLETRARAGGAAWTLANRAWVQSGFGLLPGYVATVRDGFGYDLGEADFAHAAEPARVAINQWVEEKTEKRIQELFPAGSIDGFTRLVLANAIYFKGVWRYQFDKKQTSPGAFHLSASQSISVPTMMQTQELGFAQLSGASVLELPYRGDQLSMLVVLPDAVDGLASLERSLSTETLGSWSASLHKNDVSVALPSFSSKKRFSLKQTLAGMGTGSAFQPEQADFSGMTGKRDLFLSAVVHEAFVKVDEEGTEAAAATGAELQVESVRLPERFVADHPFLYLIRDRATGCILFMGRVVDPRS